MNLAKRGHGRDVPNQYSMVKFLCDKETSRRETLTNIRRTISNVFPVMKWSLKLIKQSMKEMIKLKQLPTLGVSVPSHGSIMNEFTLSLAIFSSPLAVILS